MYKSSSYSTLLSILDIINFFNFTNSSRYVIISYCVLTFIVWWLVMASVFSCATGHLYVFGRVSVNSFAHFLLWFLLSPYYWILRVLYTLKIQVFAIYIHIYMHVCIYIYIYIFFNWRIIALQSCFVLVSAVQQCKSAYIPSLLSLPPSIPTSQPSQASQSPGWAPCVITQQLPTSYLFYTGQCIYVSATFPVCPTLSFLSCVPESVLYTCTSIPALQIGSALLFF